MTPGKECLLPSVSRIPPPSRLPWLGGCLRERGLGIWVSRPPHDLYLFPSPEFWGGWGAGTPCPGRVFVLPRFVLQAWEGCLALRGLFAFHPPKHTPPTPQRWAHGVGRLVLGQGWGMFVSPPFSRLCSIQAEEKLLAPLFPQAKSRLQQWRELGGVRVFLPLGSPLSC